MTRIERIKTDLFEKSVKICRDQVNPSLAGQTLPFYIMLITTKSVKIRSIRVIRVLFFNLIQIKIISLRCTATGPYA